MCSVSEQKGWPEWLMPQVHGLHLADAHKEHQQRLLAETIIIMIIIIIIENNNNNNNNN